MVVLPALGGSLARMREPRRSRQIQKRAASSGGMVPAWRICVMERGKGRSDQPCHPPPLPVRATPPASFRARPPPPGAAEAPLTEVPMRLDLELEPAAGDRE